MQNCAWCLGAGGTTGRIAAVQMQYLAIVGQALGYTNPMVQVRGWGILAPAQIQKSINDGAPILAGISPGSIPFPPGLGISQHAVVIVGYDIVPNGSMVVILNDPFPPNVGMYQQIGAGIIQPGRYAVPYSVLVGTLQYANSISYDPAL
jgi:hypothetical protein